MRRIKILTRPPGLTDATQWYRGAGPLGKMAKDEPVDVVYMKELDWGSIKEADVLFLLRPCTDTDLYLIEMAKNLGTKVWVDFDDLLLEVPTDNPMQSFYNSPKTQRNVEACLHAADVATVSTEQLKLKLEQYQKNIWVVPNALDEILIKRRPPYAERKVSPADVIAWRGSPTHTRDLFEYSEGIINASQKTESAFAFMGYNPWFLKEKIGPRAIVFNTVAMLEYQDALCALNPKVLYVPLHDSDFNRCKSNIAALEGILAGAVILAPDWPQWQLPGVLTYKSVADFSTKLEALVTCSLHSNLQELSWEHVQENFLLMDANHRRFRILTEDL